MDQYLLDGMHVLLLEDEYLIAMDVEELCREHGAETVTVAHSMAALGANPFDEPPFHVAILDIMLAGQTTLDFAEQLARRNIPFIFATGYSDSGDMFDTLKGAIDEIEIVGKPYSGDTLIAALTRAIARTAGDQAALDPIT